MSSISYLLRIWFYTQISFIGAIVEQFWVLVWKSKKEISAICVYILWTENFLFLERAYSLVVHMTSERTWTHEIMKFGSMKKISSRLAISTDITLGLVRGCIGIFNNVLAYGKKTRFKSKDQKKQKKIQRHTLFYSIDWEIEVPIYRFIRSSQHTSYWGNTSVSFHVVLMDVSLSISPRIQELFCDLGLNHIVVLHGIANS